MAEKKPSQVGAKPSIGQGEINIPLSEWSSGIAEGVSDIGSRVKQELSKIYESPIQRPLELGMKFSEMVPFSAANIIGGALRAPGEIKEASQAGLDMAQGGLNRMGFGTEFKGDSPVPDVSIGHQRGMGTGQEYAPPYDYRGPSGDPLPTPEPPALRPGAEDQISPMSPMWKESTQLETTNLDLGQAYRDQIGQGGGQQEGQPEAPGAGAPATGEEERGGGPGFLSRLGDVAQDPGFQQAVGDFGRSMGRPGSDRPFARMGFDAQSSEIDARRDKQAALDQKERMGMEEIASRERIAGADRDAQTSRYEAMYGQPITPALAAAMGIPVEEQAAWVGRSVDEYASLKREETMKSQMEANNSYKMMLAFQSLDKSDEMLKLAQMVMTNPMGMQMLQQSNPALFHGLKTQLVNRGLWQEPPPGADLTGPIPEETKGWIGTAIDRASSLWTELWGGEPEGPKGPGPGRVNLEGLSSEDSAVVTGIITQHEGDPGMIESELNDYIKSRPQEQHAALKNSLYPLIAEARRN